MNNATETQITRNRSPHAGVRPPETVQPENSTLSKITPNAPPTAKVRFPANEARCLLQAEAGITSADCRWPIIGSFGANPCVILAIQDTATGVVGLAHIDAGTDTTKAVQTLTQTTGTVSAKVKQQRVEKRQAVIEAAARATPQYQKLIQLIAEKLRLKPAECEAVEPNTTNAQLVAHMTTASPRGNTTLRQLKAAIKIEPRLKLGCVANKPGMAIDTRDGALYFGDFRQKNFGKSSSILVNAITTAARIASNRLQPLQMQFINDDEHPEHSSI